MANAQQAPLCDSGEGQETLLGYKWDCKRDLLSTNRASMMNIHPPKRGIRPSWSNIREAEDLLRLHKDRQLRHRHLLSAGHSTYDPLGAAPWVGAINKFVYRLLILNIPLQTSPTNKYKDI